MRYRGCIHFLKDLEHKMDIRFVYKNLNNFVKDKIF